MDKKIKFSNISKEFSGRIQILEDKKNGTYVKFGDYNSFGNEL